VRLAGTLAAATAALALAACGADDVRNAAVAQCLREAERIQDPAARAAAEEGCRAAEDGQISGEDATRSARERCERAAQDIADPAARREAERACEDIR
jgi:hypothetical protein